MALIEVDEDTKQTVVFAARMANLSESAIVRRLIAASPLALDIGSGARRSLQSIRPGAVRSGRGSLRGRLVAADDWDCPEANESGL
ncbi:hypothetical protein AB0J83_13995 [Actinoplanes sp. NPDC049596]|uniref:hypothetical protein n=1 Tax=unclassified Actinoplanes TaxID=2626549 RepID=UPI00342A928E